MTRDKLLNVLIGRLIYGMDCERVIDLLAKKSYQASIDGVLFYNNSSYDELPWEIKEIFRNSFRRSLENAGFKV